MLYGYCFLDCLRFVFSCMYIQEVKLLPYSRAYFVKNISTLLFLRHLSTLENYSRFFTLDSRLFTLDSRPLLSTLDIYCRLSTFYSRLSTFTLNPRLLDTLICDCSKRKIYFGQVCCSRKNSSSRFITKMYI